MEQGEVYMKHIRIIVILSILFLIGGCLAPPWDRIQCPAPSGGDAAVAVADEVEEDVEEEPELFMGDTEGLPKKEVKAGQLIYFPNLKANDPDGDRIYYTFSEPLNESGAWQTEEGDEGEYVVSITASDGESTVSQEVLIVVTPSNYAPTIEIEDTIIISEGETLSLSTKVSDKDGDDVEISYEGWQTELPYEVSFEDAGIYTITIIASDGKKTTEKEVDIIVENVNRPPTVKKINDAVVTEHDTVTIAPKIEDPDGDDLLTSFSTPFDEQGIWKTSGGDAGEYEVTIEVTDGEYIAQTIFTLTVKDFNDPPVITVSDVTVTEGETVELEIEAVDPEGEDVEISISGWMTSETKVTDYYSEGEHEVVITASDGEATAQKTIIVTVEDVNRAPVFNPGAFN